MLSSLLTAMNRKVQRLLNFELTIILANNVADRTVYTIGRKYEHPLIDRKELR